MIVTTWGGLLGVALLFLLVLAGFIGATLGLLARHLRGTRSRKVKRR